MRFLLIILCTLGLAGSAAGHEFWVSPARYIVPTGAPVEVTTRIGEKFKAPSRPFLPGSFVRFDAVSGDMVVPVTGRIGDDPVSVELPDGLAVLVLETKDLGLRYTDPAKWPQFVEHKAFPGAMAAHTARGLGLTGFHERYRRFAKSLVAGGRWHGVGSRAGPAHRDRGAWQSLH